MSEQPIYVVTTGQYSEDSEYRELGTAYTWGAPGYEQAAAASYRGFDVAAQAARDELAAYKAGGRGYRL